MAAPKSEKKIKSATKKRAIPSAKNLKNPEKKKKMVKAPEKKILPKIVKPLIKPKASERKEPTKSEHEATRRQLFAMRAKLLSEIAENRIPESLATPSEIGDLVDQAGDERDRELSLLLTGRDKEKLLAINEALEKVDEGTYGVCEECGDKIGAGRLKVMPLAKLCVLCQSSVEKETSVQRKAEEELKYRGLGFASTAEEEEG